MTGENGKIFAIGDIHGVYSKLRDLLARLPYKPGRDRLVFLGDYLDRGPDSAKVLDLLCELKSYDPDIIALLGNHEYLLLEYYRSGDPILLPYLRAMGLDATLNSYGPRSGFNLQTLNFLPEEHLSFLQNLLPYWESSHYIYVHAGLEPGIPLAENDLTTLCEARDSFITRDHDFGKKVIFGHTPFELPLVTPTKIGIDTGAMYANLLTAIQLPDEIFFHS
jgi:serine/threonine protein phosphatase 1